ncbi:hypothetical protein PUN28_019070 [Cardiocondyla obscurior]|uniref:Uncharacterized protein n=1 Tax=Cardiocondyla obscurior TaxID=286306 RepID=A0AAW2EIN6_9HYME
MIIISRSNDLTKVSRMSRVIQMQKLWSKHNIDHFYQTSLFNTSTRGVKHSPVERSLLVLSQVQSRCACMARRSRDRRTCDSVRGHSTTPWPPWVPGAAPADAGPATTAVEEGAAAAAIADEDDLHHHGNWVGVNADITTWLINTPTSFVATDTWSWTDAGSVAPTAAADLTSIGLSLMPDLALRRDWRSACPTYQLRYLFLSISTSQFRPNARARLSTSVVLPEQAPILKMFRVRLLDYTRPRARYDLSRHRKLFVTAQ